MTLFPEVYRHACPRATVAPILQRSLPQSLPLLRRIQFHYQSPHSRVLATFPPSTLEPDSPWAALYVDRSRAPETECWSFCSLETSSRGRQGVDNRVRVLAQKQILSLLQAVKSMGVPNGFADHAEGQDPFILVVGAVDEIVVELLQGLDGLEGGRPKLISGSSGPWSTFVFPVSMPAQIDSAVQEKDRLLADLGLEWTVVEPSDFAIVRSRTGIPRRDRTLVLLPSAGLRRKDDSVLVSWAFLGPDGSLSSLHVEEQYRGQGIAKLVAKKVLSSLGPGRDNNGKGFVDVYSSDVDGVDSILGYSHAAAHNLPSIGVAKALGATEEQSICWWCRIDLDVLQVEPDV